MNLFEYEGKKLMKQYGIPVPKSHLLVSSKETAPMSFPFVLKAQVMTGGRGKAGGVRICHDQAEYEKNAEEILNMQIKGHQVHGLLAEEMMQIQKELYLSITLQGVKVPTLIFSRMGGMDIEQVAKEQPEEIIKIEIDPFTGLKDYQLHYLADKAETENKEEFIRFVKSVEHAFFAGGALLTEINPLAAADGHFVAMDSKFVIDGHARHMQETMNQLKEERKGLYLYWEEEEENTTITYVPLKGNVGLISDGAGTGMLTLDLLRDAGVEVASFCELGGMTSPEVMHRAMELTLEDHPETEAVIVVLIGGFNRMDNMALGLTSYCREHDVKIPVFCRMCGTMQEKGIEIMKENGKETFDSLTETVQSLVRTVKGEA